MITAIPMIYHSPMKNLRTRGHMSVLERTTAFHEKDYFQKSSCVWPQSGVVARNFQKPNAEHSHIEHIPQIKQNLFRSPHSIHHALHLILALQEHKHKNHMAHKQKHAESNTNQTKITNKTLLDIILFSLMRAFFWCLLRLFSFSIS